MQRRGASTVRCGERVAPGYQREVLPDELTRTATTLSPPASPAASAAVTSTSKVVYPYGCSATCPPLTKMVACWYTPLSCVKPRFGAHSRCLGRDEPPDLKKKKNKARMDSK